MRARSVAARTLMVVGAWLPFYLFWVLFYLTYAGETQTLAKGLSYGLVAIGSAAILGVAVWQFCARNQWPPFADVTERYQCRAALTLPSKSSLLCVMPYEK